MVPVVSIIVPVYNVEKTIGRCIESILCQSYNLSKTQSEANLLDKFALAILDSENVCIDIPIYVSLLTMILYQEYNIEINSIYDNIINVLYKALKA